MVAHNCHDKTKKLTAKTKTSRQNQILHSESKIALVLPWVFAFAVRYLVFAVKYLVLPWGLWFYHQVFGFVMRYFVFAVRFLVLLWGFCYWCEVFGFAMIMRYFVFAVRFLVLAWGILFLLWGFRFCREVFGFAVRYFVFLPWGFWFCCDSCWATVSSCPWNEWSVRHFFATTKTTQPRPQVFSVNCALTCSRLHFWCRFLVKQKILPNLVISNWLWWIMRVLLANQNWGNILNK